MRSSAKLIDKALRTLVTNHSVRFEGTLAHTEFASSNASNQDAHVALVLHGVLGQGKNWRTFSKRLAQEAEDATAKPWRVLTLDLRCHGESSTVAGFAPPHDMRSCAGDVVDFVTNTLRGQSPAIVCGHSLGGKVVLEYLRHAVSAQSRVSTPREAWVLDSQPGVVPAEVGADVRRVIDAVEGEPLPVTDRNQLLERLRAQGFTDALVGWIGSNLVPDPHHQRQGQNGYRWAFDVHGANEMYRNYCATDSWDVLAAPPRGATVNVLRAARSDRWNPEMTERLAAVCEQARETHIAAPDRHGKTVAHVLEGAGHWVHFDQPARLREMLLKSFVRVAGEAPAEE